MKRALRETQILHAGYSKAEPKKIWPTATADPLPGGAAWPNFNQFEMVTTFTYKPSLVRIDARNFEISWPHTLRQDRLQYTVPQCNDSQYRHIRASLGDCWNPDLAAVFAVITFSSREGYAVIMLIYTFVRFFVYMITQKKCWQI